MADREQSDGLLWFIAASYRYIAPHTVAEHVRFVVSLPGAAWRYMRMRARDVTEP